MELGVGREEGSSHFPFPSSPFGMASAKFGLFDPTTRMQSGFLRPFRRDSEPHPPTYEINAVFRPRQIAQTAQTACFSPQEFLLPVAPSAGETALSCALHEFVVYQISGSRDEGTQSLV